MTPTLTSLLSRVREVTGLNDLPPERPQRTIDELWAKWASLPAAREIPATLEAIDKYSRETAAILAALLTALEQKESAG